MPIRTMMMQRRRGRHVDKQQNDRQQQDRSRYDNLWMDPSDQSVDAVRSAIFISSQHMGLDRHQQQHQQPPRGDRDNSHGRRRRRGSRGRRRRGRRRCRTADSDASSSIPSDENEDDTDNADNDRDFEFGFDDDYDDDVIDDGYQDHAVDGTSTADDEVGSSYKKRGRQKQQRRTGVGGELTVSDEDDDDDDSVLIDEAVNKLWPRQRAGGGDSTTVAGSSSDGTSNASPAAIISYGSRTIGNDRKVWKFLPTENSVITRMSRARSLIAKDKLSFTKLKLFGRSEETKQLEECLQRFMTIPAPAPSTDDDVNMKHASVDGILRQNSSSGRSVRPEIILLNGGAGVGKKTMADYVERRMVRKSTDGIFLCGTFKPNDLDNVQSQYGHQQLQRPPQPYSAITSACQKLCGKLLHISRSDRPRWCRLRSRLVERIGPVRVWLRTPLSTSPSSSFADNWKVLFQLLPDLEDVMTCADRTCLHVESQPKDDALLNASESPESSSQAASHLVHELFRQFIRTVISDEGLYKHIIVSFDDLQYADEDSLDLLHSMAFYKDVPILVIATYRSDEFKENPLLESFVTNIRKSSCPSDDTDSNSSANLTELEITNFDTEQVRELLMIVLDYDPTPALSDLAHFCYKRTRGNMKQLKIFLRNIQTKDMLTFNPIDWKWEWDLNRMISMTCAMDNVLDDLVQRLLHLPRAVQQRLSTASLLGPTFDASIESIVSNCLYQNDDESLIYKHDDWLEFVEEKEIIEPILKDDGNVEYKWTHMKLRDTSMGLIGQEEYAAFKVDVARILLNNLSQEQKEEHVCMMADLLVSSKEKITSISSANIAIICCLASKKAAEKVSYESMYAYATTGIRYLPDEKWNQHYQLSLDLYNFAMKSASTLGLEEEMLHFFEEIVRQEEISFVDKTSAYTALIHSRSAENDVSGKMKAVGIAQESLAQFGLNFPSGTIQRRMASVRLLFKLKRRLRKITPLDVVSWPAATDPVKLCVMDLLSHSTRAVFVDRDLLNLWILTLGWYALDAQMMHKYLPLSFAQLGVVFSDMNEYSTASKCGELVDTLWAAFPEECGETCSETVAYSSSSIFPFSRPYHAVRKPLLEKGYANGLLLGQKSAVETVSFNAPTWWSTIDVLASCFMTEPNFRLFLHVSFSVWFFTCI